MKRPSTKLSPEQTNALRNLVSEYVCDRIASEPDLYVKRGGPSRDALLMEPSHWAGIIVAKWTTRDMLAFLDLDNQSSMYVECALDSLGFDPRSGEQAEIGAPR